MKPRIQIIALNLLAIALLCANVFGQATASATLEGTIVDKSAAVIKGAQVTATNIATGLSRSTTTDDQGFYRLDQLPVGTYDVKVSATGFGNATAQKIELAVGRASTANLTLSPGSTEQIVNVTAEAPLIDQEKTDVSRSITPAEIENLPLNGRDFANLAYLAPGAKPVDSYDPTKNRIAIFGINGSSGRNVNVTINGIDNKDNTVGGPVMQFPLEAIQEFVISTQRFSAANGRSEGAAVNVVTKSGGNQFHGAAYFFDRNQAMNSLDYFSQVQHGGTGEKPDFDRQQFGGSIGGPFLRNKDFFFFALERQREHTSIPVTGQAFTELSLVQSLGAQPVNALPTPYFDWRYNGRFDHRFSDSENMFLTYSAQTNKGDNDQSTNTNDLTAGNFTTNELQLANLTLNSVLTPRIVNSLTGGFQYWNNLIDTPTKVPTFVFPGGITFGTNTNVPQQSYQRKWQFKDDLSISRGKHTFKTGVDYLWEPKLGGFFEFNPTLELDFLDLPSAILSNAGGVYPQGFKTPGAVVGMSATAGNPYFDLPGGAKMFGAYFQDDWKLTPRFSLSLGLRWDKDYNLIGSSAAAANRTYLALKAINSPFAASLPHDDNKDFSPRIGMAWDLTGNGKQVLRAGYGLYYGQVFLNIPLFMIQQANPTLFSGVFAISSAGPNDPGCVAPACTVPGTNILLSKWRLGTDPNPTIPPPQTQLAAGNTGRLMDPLYRNPYSQQFNVGYSYELGKSSVVELEYVHELALHESKTININPTGIGPGPSFAGTPRPLSAAFTAAGLPALGRIDDEQSIGRSRYDGLNFSYRQRMTHHVSLNTNYVFSRAVAYNGNAAAFRNRPTMPSNPFNPADFGPTPNDERHRWVLSGVVDLPWGLQFAPIMQLASARPYNAIQNRDVFGIGSGRGSAHAIVNASDPNNLTANAGLSSTQLRACLATGTCIQSPFDQVRGQAFFQLDTRLSKAIRFGERSKLELIFQAFDLTNRANFGNNFDSSVRDTTFGQPQNYITPNGVIVPHSFSAEFGVKFNF